MSIRDQEQGVSKKKTALPSDQQPFHSGGIDVEEMLMVTSRANENRNVVGNGKEGGM